jgi:DNA modification methylase
VTPYYADDWLTVYGGDCREVMRSMEPESVHCVVTSPPYWGLRDYGDAGQLGLEPTPEEYVANMVEVFREVRRVLRSDGTVWLNLGDSYAGGGGFAPNAPSNLAGSKQTTQRSREGGVPVVSGLKPKDLVGIPWRVAFALQADGWYLRSDIIWSKPNPMPESVTDRPTKSHEYLFLLSKSPRYYFDADAVRTEGYGGDSGRAYYANRGLPQPESTLPKHTGTGQPRDGGNSGLLGSARGGANLRSVWTIATQPYPGAHFATFPRKLVEPCIKAGTSERGVCPECGAPWVRVVATERGPAPRERGGKNYGATAQGTSPTSALRKVGGDDWYAYAGKSETTGWRPSCTHAADPIPATVLDPFAGSGTTGMVAQSLGRRAVLIDLNPDYLAQAMTRNRDIPLGLEVA